VVRGSASPSAGLSPSKRKRVRRQVEVQDASEASPSTAEELSRSEGQHSDDAEMSEFTNGASSSSTNNNNAIHEEGSAEAEDGISMLRSMQRKKDIFQQLWKGIAELQNGEGESISAWKSKINEVESAKADLAKLSSETMQLKSDLYDLRKDRDDLKAGNLRLKSELDALKTESSAYKDSAEGKLSVLEESKNVIEAQFIELKQQEEIARILSERRLIEVEELRKKNQVLKDEISAQREEIDAAIPIQKQLEERVALLQSQLGNQAKSQDETAIHLSELTQENWGLKQKVSGFEKENADLKEKLENETKAAKEAAEQHEASSSKLQVLHEDLLSRLKTSEERMQVSRKAAEKHSFMLEEHVGSLKGELVEAHETAEKYKNELHAATSSSKIQADDAEAQLSKIRKAMRQVQDKHLQDVIRFEESRKKLEAKVEEEEKKREGKQKAVEALEKEIENLEAIKTDAEASTERIRAELETEFKEKLATLVKNHSEELEEVKGKLVEATSAVRNEAREAQRYKKTLAKAAKEEHDKIQKEIHEKDAALEKLKKDLKTSQEEICDLRKSLEEASENVKNAHVEQREKEQELERLLMESQHEITSKESTHVRECTRLREEIERQKSRVAGLEEEKRDLIMDCKRLTDEVQASEDCLVAAEESKRNLEAGSEDLRAKIDELRREISLNEESEEARIESLQQENDNHVASRAEALEMNERLSRELKEAKKRAAEQINQYESSRQKVSELERVAKEHEEDAINYQTQLEATKERLAGLEMQFEQQKAMFEEKSRALNDTISELSKQSSKVHIELKEREDVIAQLETELRVLREEDGSASTELQAREQELKDMEKSKQELIMRLSSEQESSKLLRLEIEQRKVDMAELQQKCSSKSTELQDLERRNEVRAAGLSCELQEYRTEVERAQQAERKAIQEIEVLQAQLEALRESSETSLQEYMDEVKSAEEERKNNLKAIQDQFTESEKNLSETQSKLEALQKEFCEQSAHKLQEVQSLQEALKLSQQNAVQVLQELDEKTNLLDTLQHEKESTSKTVAALEKRLTSIEQAKAELEKELEEEKAANLELRSQAQSSESEIRSKLREEAESHMKVKNGLVAAMHEKDWKLNEAEVKISALQREVDNIKTDLRRREEEIEHIKQKLRAEQEEHERFRHSANASLASLRDTQSTDDSERRQELEIARETAEEAAQLCAKMEQERTSLQRKIRDLTSELELSNTAQEELREEFITLQNAHREAVAAKRKLESEAKMHILQQTPVKTTATTSQDDLLRAEKEGYEIAKSEYQQLLLKTEQEQNEHISKLTQEIERLREHERNLLLLQEDMKPTPAAKTSKPMNGGVKLPSTRKNAAATSKKPRKQASTRSLPNVKRR